MLEYRIATHVGSGMVRHVLEEDRLVVEHEKSGSRAEIPFTAITRIQLLKELPGVHSLKISPANGKTIRVTARHFVGVGRFEARNAEYVAFSRELLRGCARHGSTARLLAGSSVLYWLGWFFLVFGTLFAAFVVYALTQERPPPRQVVFTTPLIFVIGAAFVRQGRTTEFDAEGPPAKFLPPVS